MNDDSVMDSIPFLQTSSFVVSDASKFIFVESILEAMLLNVLTNKIIVNEYRILPSYGVRTITEELRKAIEEGTKSKRGGKRKPKVAPLGVVPKLKKIKKQAHKPRSPSPIAQEASKSRTQSDVQKNDSVKHQVEDTEATSEPLVSEPTPTEPIPKVSSPISTSVPLQDEFSQVPTPPSSPVTTPILITIAPIPPKISVGVSLP